MDKQSLGDGGRRQRLAAEAVAIEVDERLITEREPLAESPERVRRLVCQGRGPAQK